MSNQYIDTKKLNADLLRNADTATDFMLEKLNSKMDGLGSMESISTDSDGSWHDYLRRVSGLDLISLHAYTNFLTYEGAATELSEWATAMEEALELL